MVGQTEATLKTYNFFAAEQAFLPVHGKGQTEMSDPPNLINHNGRSLTSHLISNCRSAKRAPSSLGDGNALKT